MVVPVGTRTVEAVVVLRVGLEMVFTTVFGFTVGVGEGRGIGAVTLATIGAERGVIVGAERGIIVGATLGRTVGATAMWRCV